MMQTIHVMDGPEATMEQAVNALGGEPIVTITIKGPRGSGKSRLAGIIRGSIYKNAFIGQQLKLDTRVLVIVEEA
jgi:ABC-type uncharacterized transport system YnjBCD ATPase subunit